MTQVLSALNPFKRPKIPATPAPPTTPTRASGTMEGPRPASGFNSLISTGSAGGLARKAETKKRSLIGG